MRGFWRECRRALATPGLPMALIVLGVTAGIQTHEGLPVDVLAATVGAAWAMVVIVLMLVLLRRIPRIRRRLDRKAHRGA
jgi:hypothetical protein